MYKIVVQSNKIIINNYRLGDNDILERSFEVYDNVTHTYNIIGMKFNDDKSISLPRGIDVDFLESLFGVSAYYDNRYIQPLKNKESILLKYKPKDDKQYEAINFMLGLGSYSYTKNYSQQLIALDTGAGKTYLGIAYMAFMNEKAIIITSSNDWLNQWKVRITEHTNLLPKDILFIQGSNLINNLLSKSQKDIADRYSIYLVTHATLLSYAKENGWNSINTLFTHLGIGVKIFDEAHLNFENMYNIDYSSNVHKTLYLTATPGRGDKKENNIFNLYFKNVPTLSLFDPENDPHTNYIAIHYKSNLNPIEVSRCVNIHGFNKMIYCDMVIYKEKFDYICRVVFDIISKIKGKKLLFLSTNNAIVYMYEWIRYNYPEYANNIGIYTSINENKTKALDFEIILTTSKSAGAALDIKDLMVSVNLAEPTHSKPQNKQRFGRTRSFNSFYIDIVDHSVKTIVNYFKNNYSMFEKYALSMKEVKFTDKTLESTVLNIMHKREIEYGISPFHYL